MLGKDRLKRKMKRGKRKPFQNKDTLGFPQVKRIQPTYYPRNIQPSSTFSRQFSTWGGYKVEYIVSWRRCKTSGNNDNRFMSFWSVE